MSPSSDPPSPSARPSSRPADPAPATGTRDRLLRAFMSLVEDLTAEREEDGLLRSSLAHVVDSLDLGGGLALVLGTEDQLEPAAEHRFTLDRGLAATLGADALAQGRAVVSGLPGTTGRLLAAPLRGRQRSLGALVVHDRAAETVLDPALLEGLGKQIGRGLENVRQYAELRASAARVDVLHRIGGAVSSGTDLHAIVPAFAAELASLQPFDRLACGFVNETGDYIEMVSHPEESSWGLGGVLPVVGSGPGFVALNNRAVLQRDLVHDHRHLEDMRLLEDGLRSYVILPLSSRGRAIGVLALGSTEGGAFDEASLARLQPLADAVALAFENVRLFQKTRELSITDEITPLHNFRHFHQALERELKLVNRYGSTLSLIFVDLDRFKPINDRYGHLRGSRTLREVGFLIRAAVRETDIPARYGGDEFVVVLPQTDGDSARVLAEKLRRLIEGHTFLQEEGINARLGVSLGVSTYPDEASTKDALIRLADRRMYEDKESRRTGR